jgi:hypothetical protein
MLHLAEISAFLPCTAVALFQDGSMPKRLLTTFGIFGVFF